MQTTLNPSEISELIKKRVEELNISAETRNEGTVVSVSDGIARLHGLEDAMQGEMIEFPGNTFGLALNLERDSVGTVILGDYEHITEGDTVKCTGRILEVPHGRGLLGRVVDALGNPIDGQGPIENDGFAPIEKVAPGVIWRKSVDQPVQTGLKSIDSMVPIGRGQRELIIGDRQIGKSAIAIDTIINQVAPALNVSTSPSARNSPPWPTWSPSWKSTAPWSTPSWSMLRLQNRRPCSTSHRTPVAPWVSTSVIAVKTP